MMKRHLGSPSFFCNSLKSVDIFGEQIEFTFNGDTRFKTWIGASISCFMCTFFIIFLALRTTKLVSNDDPFFSMTTMYSKDEVIDLWAMDFMFAIEDIDPRVGRLIVEQV